MSELFFTILDEQTDGDVRIYQGENNDALENSKIGELPPWEWRDEIGALRSASSDPFHNHPCLGGRSVTDDGMQTLAVIEYLDVIEHGRFGCLAGGEPAVMNMLDLERG